MERGKPEFSPLEAWWERGLESLELDKEREGVATVIELIEELEMVEASGRWS